MSQFFHACVVMLGVLLLGCSTTLAGVIATQEQPPTIIYPDQVDAEARRGVDLLQAVSLKAMGKAWPAQPESRAGGIAGPKIYVGRGAAVNAKVGDELDRLGVDAIAIIAQGDTLMLAGRTPFATVSAVTEFLRRHMGVEWYMPTDLFEVIPQVAQVTVPDGVFLQEPSFRSRLASGINNRMNTGPNAAWFSIQRYTPRYNFHHSAAAMFPPDKYAATPEVYSLVHGRRMIPGKGSLEGWQVCNTNQAVIDAYVKAGESLTQPGARYLSVSVSPNDGREFCECENCAKLINPADNERQAATRRVFHMVNEVARRLQQTAPGVLVGIMSYSDYRDPVPDLKVEPNVVLYLVGHRIGSPVGQADMPDGYDPRIDAWSKAGVKHFGLYEWHHGSVYNVPPIYLHPLAASMRFAARHGADGLYTEAYPSWGLQGPAHWVIARLAWDIHQDVDVLLDQYCRDLFGPAAKPMREYFDLCEEAWVRAKVGWSSAEQYVAYPRPVRDQLQSHLDQAAKLAAGDAKALERVAFFNKAFGFSQRMIAAYEQGVAADKAYAAGDLPGALKALADPSPDADPIVYMKTVCDPIPIMLFNKSDDLNMYVLSAIKRKLETRIRIAGPVISQAGRAVLAQGNPSPQSYDKQLRDAIAGLPGMSADQASGSAMDAIREYAAKAVFSPRVDAPPVIDGQLDDAAWHQAPEYADFYAYGGGVPAAYETRFRIVAHQDRLYLAAICHQDMTRPKAGGGVRDSNVWLDDAIEIFLNLPGETNPDRFAQIIANINGVTFDWHAKDKNWNPALQVATQRHADHWTLEMSIPLADVGMSPGQVQGLRVNVVRDVFGPGPGKPSQISAWFPTTFGHSDPSLRGWLFFTGPGEP